MLCYYGLGQNTIKWKHITNIYKEKRHVKLILQTILFHKSNIYKYMKYCINLKQFV